MRGGETRFWTPSAASHTRKSSERRLPPNGTSWLWERQGREKQRFSMRALMRWRAWRQTIASSRLKTLQCSVRNYVDLRAAGNVTMLDCLRACMRLKPTRIVVGEVRGAEAHTLLASLREFGKKTE